MGFLFIPFGKHLGQGWFQDVSTQHGTDNVNVPVKGSIQFHRKIQMHLFDISNTNILNNMYIMM